MRRLAWLLAACYTGLAHGQSSQPTSQPSPGLSVQVEAAPTVIPIETIITTPPTTVVPAPKAEPLPPKKNLLPELHVLLQAWYDTQPTVGAEDTFRVRRAEIKITGEIIPKRVKYNVMADLGKEILKKSQLVVDENGDPVSVDKDDDAVLQDLSVTFVLPNAAEVSIGQFKTPISLEGYSPTAKLLFPERSIVSRNFGDKRDLGAAILQKKERYYLTAGLFNGGNLNELDKNDSKDLTARAEVYPKKGFTIGAAFLSQVFGEEGAQKTRLETDFKFEKDFLVLVSELHMATDGDKPSAGGTISGLVPLPFDDRLQLGGRYALLARDLREDNANTQQELTLGLNFYLKDHQAKLQSSLSRFLDADPDKSFTEIIIAAQAWF